MISRIFHNFFSPLCKKYIRLYLYQSVNSSVSSTTLGCTFWVSSGCVYNPLRGFLVVVQVSILLQGVWLGPRFKEKIEMRKSKIDFYVKMKIFNFILLIICVTAVTDVMCNGNFSFVDKNHECFFCVNLIEPKVQTSNWYFNYFLHWKHWFFSVRWK